MYVHQHIDTITLTLITPLLPEIEKGDRHRMSLPTIGIDGYMYVEGLSADEGSRTMHLTMSADYHDMFSAQQAPTMHCSLQLPAITGSAVPGAWYSVAR